MKVVQTFPQERIPKRIQEKIVVLDMRNVEDPASRGHSQGEDAHAQVARADNVVEHVPSQIDSNDSEGTS